MLRLVILVLSVLVRALGSRRDLIVENVVLRQQLAAYKAHGRHPRIRAADRAFWVVLRQLRDRWHGRRGAKHVSARFRMGREGLPVACPTES